jgi:AcrR family transcriptional regulator
VNLERHEQGEHPDTRTAILDATIEIMSELGYAAVSSRKVAERAGLKSNLMHYYFKTMDELFLAVFRRAEERYFEAQAKALVSDQPLHALWEMSADSSNTRITGELVALANHRKSIQQEIARSSERSRRLQAAIIEKAFQDAGVPAPFPPIFLSLVMTAISRLLAMDNVLGVSAGHPETLRCIEELLRPLENGQEAASASDPG